MSDHSHTQVDSGSRQKTLSAYLAGLFLSILLTMVAFALTSLHFFSSTTLYLALAGLAITQLIVQSVCFLRLNWSKEGRQDVLSLLFVILIIVILAGGSLWIMYNLNANM